MSSAPKTEQKTSQTALPDTSELLRKMDKDLEEMKNRFEQLLKKMDKDLEEIRKGSGAK
jgi:Skp family chaperone for outer membrane proteins